jgi:hypothetical protein
LLDSFRKAAGAADQLRLGSAQAYPLPVTSAMLSALAYIFNWRGGLEIRIPWRRAEK